MAKVVAFKLELDTSDVSENIDNTITSVEDLGKQTKKTSKQMKEGFKAADKGTKGLGRSIGGLIKALGIVGVAMAAFTFMKDILSKNQKIMDALSTASLAFEIVLLKLFDAVKPLGEVLTSAFEDPETALTELKDLIVERFFVVMEGFANQFIALGDIIKSALELDWDGVTQGAKDYGNALLQVWTATTEEERMAIAESVKSFANEVAEATKVSVTQAQALTDLRNEVALLNAEQRGLQLTFQKEAEIQRQIRDDISLTIGQRQKANDQLGKILEEQFEAERKAADKRIELAEAELAVNPNSIELQAALIDAKTELADLDERITGQRSEQLVNQKALEKELFDFQQELRAATLDAREKEIEELEIYYDRLAEIARLAGESDVEIEAARVNALAELRDEFRKEDVKKDKIAKDKLLAQQKELAQKDKIAKDKSLAREKEITDAKIALAQSLSSTLGSLQSLVNQQSKEGVVASKVLAVAQIAIDTAIAMSGAIKQAQSVPFPGNIAAIAVGVAAVVAGIASAVTTLNTANVGGGTAAAPTAPPAVSAPTIEGITTNTTELGGSQEAQLAPIQAYVVETGITGSQQNISQIEGQATFGG